MNFARVGLLSSALLAGVFAFSTVGSASGGIRTTAEWSPGPIPPQYSTTAGPNAVKSDTFISDVCETETQLDCVESIAAYLGGAWVQGQPTADMFGPARVWRVPGLTNLDGSNKVAVLHNVKYTGNIFLQTDLSVPIKDGDRDETGLQRNVKFKATVRTSWVLPTHVKGGMTEAKFTVEKLPVSGASRITMEGIPMVGMVVHDESTLTSETGKGAYEVRGFSMTVSDGRFYPIKKECIEKPTIMTSDNGYGISLPKFENGNLDLRLSSPHFRSDGRTVHMGVYEASIPLETAKCLWGDQISTASQFSVEVIESNGSTRTATRTVNVTSDAVSIKATNFTYSSPTIRVSWVNPSATTTPSTAGALASSTGSKPPRPAALVAKGSRSAVTVTFTRVSGVSYTVTAVKGTKKKFLRCVVNPTKSVCSARGLARGSWKVTVTPRNSAGTGSTATKSVSVG